MSKFLANNQLRSSVLVIFSVPFIRVFYFLRSSVEGGVRFGLLGFCTELADICSPKKFVFSLSVVLSYQLSSHCTRFGYQFAWGGVDILITPLPMILLLYPVGTSDFHIYKWIFGTDP